jgi:RHS repeat-associated protein
MLTGLAGKIMTYDGENRPLSVTHLGKRTCYVYGVDGKRLKKVEGLAPTQDCTALPANANATVYFGAVEVRNWLVAGVEQVLTYPHPAVKLLNGVTPAAATYLHRDGLGSVRAITNTAGAKIEAALYKPFGEQSEWVLPGNAAPETKGWIGERYDADAGLQYLNARYYDPELSLFLQPDWFEVTKAGVGTNRFSYSANDPVNKLDPDGNAWWNKEARKAAVDKAKDVAKAAATRATSMASQKLGKVAERIGKKVDNAARGLDAYDASVQAAEGNWAGAIMSGLGAFDLGYGGNIAKVYVATKRAELAMDAIKNRGKLSEALTKTIGGKPSAAHTANHMIPVDSLDNDLVQKALEGGFDFNGRANGMWAIQKGKHPNYSARVGRDLADLAEENPGILPSEARSLIESYVDDLRLDVQLNKGIID